MFHFHSLPVGVTVTLVSIIVLHLCTCVHCVPLMRNDEERDPALYNQLHNVLRQAFLQNRFSAQSFPPSPNHLPLPRQQILPRPPTDTPSLTDLMRSALQSEQLNLPGRQTFPLLQGEPLPQKRAEEEAVWKRKGRDVLKRSFDSISRSSGFGMSRGGWGGLSRYGGDNLTFTFESLFPAIARGLRSIRR